MSVCMALECRPSSACEEPTPEGVEIVGHRRKGNAVSFAGQPSHDQASCEDGVAWLMDPSGPLVQPASLQHTRATNRSRSREPQGSGGSEATEDNSAAPPGGPPHDGQINKKLSLSLSLSLSLLGLFWNNPRVLSSCPVLTTYQPAQS